MENGSKGKKKSFFLLKLTIMILLFKTKVLTANSLQLKNRKTTLKLR